MSVKLVTALQNQYFTLTLLLKLCPPHHIELDKRNMMTIITVLFTSSTDVAANSLHQCELCWAASFHSPLSRSVCCCLLVSGYSEQELGNILTEHHYICQESDPGGLERPATFHLWQVRKWEWENGKEDVRGWRSSPRQLETPLLDRIPAGV